MNITAALRDTPYRFVQALGPYDIELAYGDIHEHWRRQDCFHGCHGRYIIRVVGVGYCFIQRLDPTHGPVRLAKR